MGSLTNDLPTSSISIGLKSSDLLATIVEVSHKNRVSDISAEISTKRTIFPDQFLSSSLSVEAQERDSHTSDYNSSTNRLLKTVARLQTDPRDHFPTNGKLQNVSTEPTVTLSGDILAPVPHEMTEAIKRQQVGSGSIRYGRGKTLPTDDANILKSNPTNSHNVHFPLFRHLPDSKTNGHVLRNDKMKGQWCQDGNMQPEPEIGLRTALGFNYPASTSTFYLRRSVTSFESLVSPPFSHYQNQRRPLQLQPTLPPHHALSQPLHTYQQKYLERNKPTDKPNPQKKQEEAISRQSPNSVQVSGLTCLQLADTILGTKTTDLSRFYQICQAKTRYADILEHSSATDDERGFIHSATLRPNASHRGNLINPFHPLCINSGGSEPLSYAKSHVVSPRPKNKGLNDTAVTCAQAADIDDGHSKGKSTVVENSIRNGGNSNSFLPKLTTGNNLTSSQSKPSLSSNNQEHLTSLRPSVDSMQWDSANTAPRSKENVMPSIDTVRPILKPALKDFPSHGVHNNYSLAARQAMVINTDCLKPLETSQGSSQHPNFTDTRQTQGDSPHWSRDRGKVTLGPNGSSDDTKKRAVRFSVSNEVFEFAPSEPVNP